MGWATRPLLPTLVITICALLVSAALWALAAATHPPRQEEMALDDRRVVVEYATSASAEEIMLPFYPGAEVESSFSYNVKTREGVQITYYASAVLATADSPGEVAREYRARLPGRPEPEIIEDACVKRWVLAVAEGDEVRKVSITAREGGARIEVTRAVGPVVPKPALRPQTPGGTPA